MTVVLRHDAPTPSVRLYSLPPTRPLPDRETCGYCEQTVRLGNQLAALVLTYWRFELAEWQRQLEGSSTAAVANSLRVLGIDPLAFTKNEIRLVGAHLDEDGQPKGIVAAWEIAAFVWGSAHAQEVLSSKNSDSLVDHQIRVVRARMMTGNRAKGPSGKKARLSDYGWSFRVIPGIGSELVRLEPKQ